MLLKGTVALFKQMSQAHHGVATVSRARLDRPCELVVVLRIPLEVLEERGA